MEKFIRDYNTNEDFKKSTFIHKLPGDNITDLGRYSGADTVSREDSNIIGPKLPEDYVGDDKIKVLKFSHGKMVSKHNFYLYYTTTTSGGRRRKTNRKKSKRRKTKRRKSTRRR